MACSARTVPADMRLRLRLVVWEESRSLNAKPEQHLKSRSKDASLTPAGAWGSQAWQSQTHAMIRSNGWRSRGGLARDYLSRRTDLWRRKEEPANNNSKKEENLGA